MKICWDNLEKLDLWLTDNGNFRSKTRNATYYIRKCKNCKQEFLAYRIENKQNSFCSRKCSAQYRNYRPMLNRKHSKETKEILNL